VIWLNPLALVGMAAIVAPIVIHILVQRRAPSFPFPTLRFLQPTRLASIRRHVLEDLPLLLVRAAILAIAAAALAGPFLVTPARRAEWNGRVARMVVVHQDTDGAPERAAARPAAPSIARAALSEPPAAFQTAIETPDLRDGIARAVAWFDAAPPARRELVVVAPFALGSLARIDLAEVPPEVGIRLVRSGELPATRSFAAPQVLVADLAPFSVHRRNRTIDLNGPSTTVREDAPAPAAVPVEIVASAEVKRAAEATLAAVLSQRVPAPIPDRTVRVVFDRTVPPIRSAKAVALRKPEGEFVPWIAEAIARLTLDADLPSAGTTATSGARIEADPDPDVVTSTVARADGWTLVVTTKLAPSDLRTARLLRSIFYALAADNPRQSAQPVNRSANALAERHSLALAEREVLTIPDADLRAWERPAGDVRSPRLDRIERDDRRWWWGAALALLALEAWLRRARRERANEIDEEAARVA
jgi:hypothetical protein